MVVGCLSVIGGCMRTSTGDKNCFGKPNPKNHGEQKNMTTEIVQLEVYNVFVRAQFARAITRTNVILRSI